MTSIKVGLDGERNSISMNAYIVCSRIDRQIHIRLVHTQYEEYNAITNRYLTFWIRTEKDSFLRKME